MAQETIDVDSAVEFVCGGCILRRKPGLLNHSRCAFQNPRGTFLAKNDLFMNKELYVERWRLPDGTQLLAGLTIPQIIEHYMKTELCTDKRPRAPAAQFFG